MPGKIGSDASFVCAVFGVRVAAVHPKPDVVVDDIPQAGFVASVLGVRTAAGHPKPDVVLEADDIPEAGLLDTAFGVRAAAAHLEPDMVADDGLEWLMQASCALLAEAANGMGSRLLLCLRIQPLRSDWPLDSDS